MALRIVCDSAADVPPKIAQAYGVTVVPLHVRVGEVEAGHLYADVARFWELVRGLGGRPMTAAPSPEHVATYIRPLVEQGHEVLAITLTSALSAVYDVFRAAAGAFGRHVHVFDSQNLSLGAGVQVIEAARMAQSGHALPTILERLHALRQRVRLQAVLDTLDWAEHGGRIASLMPLIRRSTRLFGVKVLLHVVEGEVRLLGVQRSWQAAVDLLFQRTVALAPVATLWVVHTRRDDAAHELAERLAHHLKLPPDQVQVHEAGPILASHVGPGALGTVVVPQ